MDYFISSSALVQIEFTLDEHAHNVYRVVTFFRNSHIVDISEPTFHYVKAKRLFDSRCNLFI